MKPILFLFFTTLAAKVFLPGNLYGHGVEVYDITDEPDRTAGIVYFKYTTGEPMMYAAIKLYPPSKPEVESLQSITDRNGIFSFIPDEEGEWRIDAEDGMGHKGTIFINAAAPKAASGAAASGGGDVKISRPLGIAAGLSFIINIFSLWYFAAIHGRKRKGDGYAHQ
ncbi:MAG: hypothetical protein LBP32_01295 [Spirochaetaceae bacterium]|jgi:nickel transport protein|nr:hypothetical protein [Spirochaetaceae bacterium]